MGSFKPDQTMSNPAFLNDGTQGTNAGPTITTLEISTHLDLLASFDRLLDCHELLNRESKIDEHVLQEPGGSLLVPGTGSKMGSRAGLECFFHFAVFRFELWLGRIADYLPSASAPEPPGGFEIELTLEYLPPLDVLMVWYSYCQHSRQYYEDSLRLYPILHHLKFPTRLAAAEYAAFSWSRDTERPIEGEAGPRLGTCLPVNYRSRAGRHAVALWCRLTNTPFDPLEFALSPTLRTFVCPGCDGTLESPFYIKQADSVVELKHTWSDNTDECRLNCQSCRWSGLKRDLGLLRFLRDLHSGLETGCSTRAHDDDDRDNEHQNDNEVMNCLAGSLTTDVRLKDFRAASAFSKLVLDQTCPSAGSLPGLLDIPGALRLLGQVGKLVSIGAASDEPDLQEAKHAWDRLLVIYSVPEPFSVDLIHAVKMESWFVRKMVRLGWTMSEDDTEEHSAGQERATDRQHGLERSIARYQAFAELVSATPSALVLIPTLDIDLVWKTDRLRGIKFAESMKKHNKQMINHPNELGMDRWSWLAHFKLTAAMWIERYSINYSRYGAPFANVKGRRTWLRKVFRDIQPRQVLQFSVRPRSELEHAGVKEFGLMVETGTDETGSGKEPEEKGSVQGEKEGHMQVWNDASAREVKELQDERDACSRSVSNASERGQPEPNGLHTKELQDERNACSRVVGNASEQGKPQPNDQQTGRSRVRSITNGLGFQGHLPNTSKAPAPVPDSVQAQPVPLAPQVTVLVGQEGKTSTEPAVEKAGQSVSTGKSCARQHVRMEPSRESLRVRFKNFIETEDTVDANKLARLPVNSRPTAGATPFELQHILKKPTVIVKPDSAKEEQSGEKITQTDENRNSKDPAPIMDGHEDKKKAHTRPQIRSRTGLSPRSRVESAGSIKLEFEIPVGKIAFVEEGNKLRCL